MIRNEDEAIEWLGNQSECDAVAFEKLRQLAELLSAESTRQNLVSATSLEAVWRRHIVDSAQLLRFVPRETCVSWLDLGTGAGFPGVVIAALRPDCQMTLVESRPLRTAWLERLCQALDLNSVTIVTGRVEKLTDMSASVISARAFAPLDKLIHLSSRFSTAQTQWVLPKGRSAKQELDSLKGWNHQFHVEHSLTDAEAGIIVGTLQNRIGDKL